MTEIKLLFTGDFCPGNRIEALALKDDYAAVFNDFTNVSKGQDLIVANLECPLTASSAARKKVGPCLKAHPQCVKILKYAHIGLVAMANNHIMDYGIAGVRETMKLCKEAGIGCVGVGETAREAARPYVATILGKKIAILNVGDAEFLTVGDGSAQANSLEIVRNHDEIKKARKQNDYVLLVIHGGHEFYSLPSPRIKKLYRFFINAGADGIIAHHAHCFSGYEIYNQKPIFYGLGNFICDRSGKIPAGWDKGYAVRLRLKGQIAFDLIPFRQGGGTPGVFHLLPEEEKNFYTEIQSLNETIADDEKLEQEFQRYCDRVATMYDAFIEPHFGKTIAALRKRGLFPRLMGGRKRLLLLNLVRCESHREVLLSLLLKHEKQHGERT